MEKRRNGVPGSTGVAIDTHIAQILKQRNWQHYLSRPFSIFGASLWHHWYDSPEAEAVLGVRCPDVLFIEEHPGIARCYRPGEQIEALQRAVRKVQANTPLVMELLQRGKQLNAQAVRILAGHRSLSSLKEGVGFLIDLALHATVFPNQFGVERFPPEVMQQVEELRSISHYPRIVSEVIMKLAGEAIRGEHLSQLTYREVLGGNGAAASHRKSGRYIYAVIDGKEAVYLVPSVEPYLRLLEPELFSSTVRGRTAYPGKAVGAVRLVNSASVTGVQFTTGDILVSVSTTPALLPLMQRAGAIITDEGGLTSHAAILARELKKPCVIGTKNATLVLKDGDMVEVDAEKGIIKKIEG